MHPTHELWKEISQCEIPDSLSKEGWRQLQTIANRMINRDFRRGSKAELGEKLLLALGYNDIQELRQAIQLEDYVEFISEFALLWDKDMNYIQIFNGNTQVWLAGCVYSGDTLKNKFFLEALPALGIKPLSKSGGVSPSIESLLLFFCDEALATETPMETYERWKESQLVFDKLVGRSNKAADK